MRRAVWAAAALGAAGVAWSYRDTIAEFLGDVAAELEAFWRDRRVIERTCDAHRPTEADVQQMQQYLYLVGRTDYPRSGKSVIDLDVDWLQEWPERYDYTRDEPGRTIHESLRRMYSQPHEVLFPGEPPPKRIRFTTAPRPDQAGWQLDPPPAE